MDDKPKTKKVYCPRGERWNTKTKKCEPKKAKPQTTSEELADTLLSFHPLELPSKGSPKSKKEPSPREHKKEPSPREEKKESPSSEPKKRTIVHVASVGMLRHRSVNQKKIC